MQKNKKQFVLGITLFLLLTILSSLFILKYFSKNSEILSGDYSVYNIESTYVFPMIADLKQGFALNSWVTSPAPFYFPDWILDGGAYAVTGFSNPVLAKNISRIIFNLLLFLLLYFVAKNILYRDKEKENIYINFCLKIIYLAFFVFFCNTRRRKF